MFNFQMIARKTVSCTWRFSSSFSCFLPSLFEFLCTVGLRSSRRIFLCASFLRRTSVFGAITFLDYIFVFFASCWVSSFHRCLCFRLRFVTSSKGVDLPHGSVRSRIQLKVSPRARIRVALGVWAACRGVHHAFRVRILDYRS